MDADDERDPLDRWLSQQAQPLPPPPGTFELITRRARRRKVRKLAVTAGVGRGRGRRGRHRRPGRAQPASVLALDQGRERGRRRPLDRPGNPVSERQRESRQDVEPVCLGDSLGDRAVRPGPPGPGQLPADVGHVRELAGRLGDRPGRHPRHVRQQGRVHLHVDRADRQRRAELAGRSGAGHHRPERGDRGQRASGSSTPPTAGPSAPSCGPPATGAPPGPRSTPRGRGSPTWRRRAGGRTRCGRTAARPRAAVPRPPSRPAAPATR